MNPIPAPLRSAGSRRYLLAVAIGALAIVMGGTAAAAGFRDDLEGWDKSRWLKSHNWANGWEKNIVGWRGENVRFRDGRMLLRLTDSPAAGRPFSSGEYQTHGFFGYGRFEVRLKSVAVPGTVTGFFTYTGPTFGSPHDEIDFEFLGKSPTQVQLNYFTDGAGQHSTDIELGFDASKDFHTYAFEWRPESIRWFVDGRLVHEETGTRGPLPSEPGKIYLDLWAGRDLDDWIGRFTYPGRPLIAEVDCVAFRPLDRDEPACPY